MFVFSTTGKCTEFNCTHNLCRKLLFHVALQIRMSANCKGLPDSIRTGSPLQKTWKVG